MAISKIIKVRHLYATISYVTRAAKTNFGELITTHECDVPFVARQFNEITEGRRLKKSRSFDIETWMIFQSFAKDEVEPHKAHEIGAEFAKRYLGNNHQYLVTTHVDSGHIHNHIVFNATDFVNYKSFDSRDKHIITDLRKENDNICRENNLSVIDEPKGKGVSQKEYYARKNNRSYKAQLEKLIDTAINNSDNYRDFLDIMEGNVEVRFGDNIAFRFPEQERFTRASSLGVDYTINSIKLRIENKSFNVAPVVDKSKAELIDTAQGIYAKEGNEGLRRWAIRKNIDVLATMSHAMHIENITSTEYLERVAGKSFQIDLLRINISEIDKEIVSLEKYLKNEEAYRKSYAFIQEYKKSDDKAAFKKAHYHDFKAYDSAKNYISKFKKDGKLPRPETIKSQIEELQVERFLKYTAYQNAKQELAALIHSDKTVLRNDKEREDVR